MFNQAKYFVKERVGVLKLSDTFDIFNPESGTQIGIAQEKISPFLKLLRLLINKRLLPTKVEVRENEATEPILSIKRGMTFLRAKVKVFAQEGREIGYFKSKLFSLGGGFYVYDDNDQQVAEVKGDWKGWNFKLISSDGLEIGTVTKKWAGVGKELFTSADNYIIALNEETANNPTLIALLLAAGLAIDIVFKEK